MADTISQFTKAWLELCNESSTNEPITVGEVIDYLVQEGYPVQVEQYANIRDNVITQMRMGEETKIANDICEMTIPMWCKEQQLPPISILENKMENPVKSTNPLLIDVIGNHLKGLPAGQVVQLSTTVDDIKAKVVKTHIVRTVRGVENEILAFTAFHISCKTPDHEKTKVLNHLLNNVYRNAGSKSNITTQQLLAHLEACEIDPMVGV